MKRLTTVALVVLVLAGCWKQSQPTHEKKSQPTYALIVGSRTIVLPVHEDAQRIQDDIVANVKPLWDNLGKGSSETFYYERSVPFDLEQSAKSDLEQLKRKVTKKTGLNVQVSVAMTATKSGSVLRFFKNRNGVNGLESMSADQKNVGFCLSSSEPGWKPIEAFLREQMITLDRIRAMQQWGQLWDASSKH